MTKPIRRAQRPVSRQPSLAELVDQMTTLQERLAEAYARQREAETSLPPWALMLPAIRFDTSDRGASSLWQDTIDRRIDGGACGDEVGAERLRAFLKDELRRREEAIAAERARVNLDALQAAAEDIEAQLDTLRDRVAASRIVSTADIMKSQDKPLSLTLIFIMGIITVLKRNQNVDFVLPEC